MALQRITFRRSARPTRILPSHKLECRKDVGLRLFVELTKGRSGLGSPNVGSLG
jgi:hypothetical protein